MSKVIRCKPALGQMLMVLLYRKQGGMADRMLQVRIPRELSSGCFLFDGVNVHFHEDDEKLKKFIVYEGVYQVQRTVGKSKKVKLRP